MTREEQKKLVSMLCKETETKLNNHIDSGHVPDDFDGFEIRWIIGDIFDHGKITRKEIKSRHNSYRRRVSTIDYYHNILRSL